MSTRPSPLLMHRTHDTGHLERIRFSFSMAVAFSATTFAAVASTAFVMAAQV